MTSRILPPSGNAFFPLPLARYGFADREWEPTGNRGIHRRSGFRAARQRPAAQGLNTG